MRLWSFLPILVAIHAATDAIASITQRATPAGTSATILTPDVIGIVQKIADANKIPGLTVAIVDKSGHVELGAWGIKSENGTNMTTDTKVANILPDAWKLMDPWASEKANLIDILTHVSGLDSHDLSYKTNFKVGDVTRNLRNLRPSFELREQWLYNNQMYIVGANIISKLSGMGYADFVKERIFKPLGMSSSTYSIDAAIKTGRFTNTWTTFGRLIPPWIREDFADLIAGPGGVISSAKDLAPWVRTIMNGGINPDTNVTIIPPKQFKIITSPHSIITPDLIPPLSTLVYGLGWILVSADGEDFLLHDGGAPGVSSLTIIARSSGIGIVALANADEKQEALTNITIAIGKNALNSPPPPLRQTNASFHLPNIIDRAQLVSFLPESLSDFRSVDKSLSPNSTDLLIAWDSVFVSHIRLTHANGTLFLASAGMIYPGGYGKNSTPFSTLESADWVVDFVVEKGCIVGFGVLHDLEQAVSVEEASDVWFVKQA
ncbi:beta-lactamase/transpeptidase-like protein [Russula brevipes]|nr:beta-lactamase/transpeptidase-like protein [Russula brevipes]